MQHLNKTYERLKYTGITSYSVDANPHSPCDRLLTSFTDLLTHTSHMAEHDFRYTLFNPNHTLIECRALLPGRYQVTGLGGSIQVGDDLIVTLKGSKSLSQSLRVEKVRYLINPPGQWVAVCSGPAFKQLAIYTWDVKCDQCGQVTAVEFAVDDALGEAARKAAAEQQLQQLNWKNNQGQHLCPKC